MEGYDGKQRSEGAREGGNTGTATDRRARSQSRRGPTQESWKSRVNAATCTCHEAESKGG